ncbi:hypothetical protein A8709_15685 [Paenibacillus pectinilyticus]|uniref:SLH domain-containing protein n=1 Tax=Paenibacillus pectinilyticus TaxID=512399 RepID=A0A1C1A4N8_9BACL|nr:S-layer homology domain-containing protein [Paenibacillus pectinilyticus]OCT15515.1 hypothetical protein A8709_15685 [Paenibacillus pectinilyticus]
MNTFRPWRRLTVPLSLASLLVSSFIVPAGISAQGSEPVATKFTGASDEWAAIQKDSVAYGQSLNLLKAVQKNGKLYLLATGTQMDVGSTTFYIDSDNVETTGEALASWSNSGGIDYKIVGDQLFHLVSGAWVGIDSVTLSKTSTVVEAAVDLSKLGLSDSSKLKVSFTKNGNSYLPDAGKTMLDVDAETTMFAPSVKVTVDGAVDDWAGVTPLGQSADGNTKLYASQNNETLSVLVTGKLAASNDVFIDTDKENSTGFASWAWPKAGADYLFENGGLFKNTGVGWSWASVVAPDIQYAASGAGDNQVIEMSVPLQSLGLSGPKPINITFNGGDYYAPAPGGNPGLVIPSLPDVTVDSNDTDWAALTPVGVSQGSKLQDLYAVVEGSKLYALAHGTDFSGEKNLFINSDNDSSTGFQGWQYTHTGADYLMQNGSVYKSAGSGWAWDFVGPAETVISSTYAAPGHSIMESVIDMSGWTNVSSTVRVSLGVGDDYAPQTSSVANYPAAVSLAGAVMTVDGLTDDWAQIDTQAVAGSTNLTLNAVQDSQKLYFLVQGANLNTQNEFFIDSDNSATTGYTDPRWAGAGIDYRIDRNSIYRYAGASADWVRVGSAFYKPMPDAVQVVVYLDQIGRVSPGAMKVGYVSKQAIALPEPGTPLLGISKVVNQPVVANAYIPRQSFDVLNNPFMGWVAWARDAAKKPAGEPYVQPNSLMYVGISWRELEPVKGQFDWAGIEAKYQFAYWSSLGKKMNLRLVLDTPTSDPTHKDIPDWLYDELVQAEGTAGAGKWYNTESIGSGFAPNYSSPVLISEHERMLKAYAAHYDNDPRVAFIQLGSLGHWGEFHNWPEDVSGKFPQLTVTNQYVTQYLDNFHHKLLGMRKPFPIAADNHFGLFNDVFGDKGSTASWLDWTINGWNEINLYLEPGENAADVQAASKIPDFWKSNFSGGEFTSGNPLQSLKDDAIMESLYETYASHTSWLGPSSPADYQVGKDGVTQAVQENMDTMLKTMGYRFILESAAHPATANEGDSVTLSTYWTNKGVAPFYMDWPVAVALADASGQIVTSSITKASQTDIRNWLPGEQQAELPLHVPSTLTTGTYTVLVGILDPQTNQPGIQLAIAGKRSDGWYALDTIAIHGENPPVSPPYTGPTLWQDDQVQQVTQVDQVNGHMSVTLDEKKSELHLPLSALANKDAALDVKGGAFSLQIPKEVMDKVQSLQQLKGFTNAQLSLSWKAVQGTELQDVVAGLSTASGSKGWSSSGGAIRLELSLIGGEGQSEVLNQFTTPLTLTLPLNANANHDLVGVYYLAEDGVPIFVSSREEGDHLIAQVSHFSSYAVLELHKTFGDVPSDHWAFADIQKLAAKHIIEGDSESEFAPNRTVNRAEFTAMLVRELGLTAKTSDSSGFNDVNQNDWYAEAVQVAVQNGLVTGIGNGAFGPNQPITRQQAAVLLQNAIKTAKLQAPTVTGSSSYESFRDKETAAIWAQDSLRASVEQGLLQGLEDETLAPTAPMTRAQASAILSRFMDLK